MIYVTKKCGNCKYSIVYRRSGYMPRMGNPFIKCPKCETWQVDREFKEYIMWKTKDYINYFGYRLLAYFGVAAVISGLIIIPINLLFKLESNIFEKAFMAIFVIFYIYYIKKIYDEFLKDKQESMERLEDKKYLELLHKSNLITEEKYNEYINSKKK